MKIIYSSAYDKADNLISKSEEAANPLKKTMESLRIRNTEIAELDNQLEMEEKRLREKRAELAAQELANTRLLDGLSKLFQGRDSAYDDMIESSDIVA